MEALAAGYKGALFVKILHLTQRDYKTSAWAGGTTTEIFLWPRDGSYADRNFQMRISSARVDLPESDFTALPGVRRYITPLQGGFTLTHEEGEPVVMGPLDGPYCFDGGACTHCVGTATDFNLMLKGVEGAMAVLRGAGKLRPGFNGFYAPEAGTVTLAGEACRLEAGDFLAVFADREAEVTAELALYCYGNILF